MDTLEFDRQIHKAQQSRPSWFQNAEPAASDLEIAEAERRVGARFPDQYRHFLSKFGAGYFGSINISSARAGSAWQISRRPKIVANGSPMLIVSDDEAGGYYGFVRDDVGYGESVFYCQPDDGAELEEVASSFFEYVIAYALKCAQ